MYELWRSVPDWPEYEVSNLGFVRRDGKILSAHSPKCGYLKVTLCARGHRQDRQVSELVLTTFKGSRPSPDHEASHRSGNKIDNRLSNLNWKTAKSNREDKYKHGTSLSKLDEGQVREVKRELARGTSANELSKRFGVGNSTIGRIKRRQSWGHIRL